MASTSHTGTMLGGFYVPGNNKAVLKETPIPTPTAKQVLVKVVAAGVCHSDVFFLSGASLDTRTYILGHENAGYPVSYVPIPRPISSNPSFANKDMTVIISSLLPCC